MKVAFLFAGQGAQYVGMGKELYEKYDIAKEVYTKADLALNFNISNLCFEGPIENLNKTKYTQPAILTTSIAILKVLEQFEIKADEVAGLSLGEYSAHVCSGSLNFEDAVKLVKKRGVYMEEAVPEGVGTMAAILGLEGEVLRQICVECSSFGIVEVANYNSPGQIVISGEVEAVKKASKKAIEKGAKRVIPLKVSGPFHTSMLKEASEKLLKELEDVKVNTMNIPVLTNVTGSYINEKEDIKELLVKQVRSSVRWEETIKTMLKDEVDTFVEIGPGKALSGFVKKIDRKVNIMNVEDVSSLEKTIEYFKS
ncbi:ACP S-malonyltransferase [Clostridium algidicarnis]|uniref:ACP S-malonyltransferase n=1 Tax=Clostridium algidicarnis TaxID=37659 RepID=UPI001C0D9E44|nr:ACP S-malonyltransferase [Clostridium algidicarnis]MBU3206147.1 ACP S-malonyltransferase [Clostridium algidicarnis]